MLPASQFFENLPRKQCVKCGSVMEEQSECYTHLCADCSGNAVYAPSLDKETSD